MANVGNTDIYASTSTTAMRRACPFTMPENGTISSISIYHNAGGAGADIVLGLYADDGGSPSKPAARLALTAETADDEALGWQTINLITPYAATSGTKYWLAYVFQDNPGIRYEAGGATADSATSWVTGMPTPFGGSSILVYSYSIYCTYTGPNVLSLAGTVNGTSSVTGAIALISATVLGLVGTSGGTSSVSGAIGANPVSVLGLIGEVAGTSSIAGAIGANPVTVSGLVGTINGTSSVTGAIGASPVSVLGLAGIINGVSSVSGAITKSYSGVWQPPSITSYHESVGYYRLLIVADAWGTPPPDGVLDIDYELVALLLPNTLLTTKRLVVAGNDQIWEEDV